jgi:hypothetical protein
LHTLKMATAFFAETDNFQHSTRLIPESRSRTLNSSRGNRRTRIEIGEDVERTEKQNAGVGTSLLIEKITEVERVRSTAATADAARLRRSPTEATRLRFD